MFYVGHLSNADKQLFTVLVIEIAGSHVDSLLSNHKPCY